MYAESRLLWMRNFDNIRGKITEPGDSPEKNDVSKSAKEQDERVKELTSVIEDTTKNYQKELQTLPVSLRDKFDNEMYQYFTSSIDTFDNENVLDRGYITG